MCIVQLLQYENLDEEHKGLFKGVFDVAANPSDAGALGNLVTLVKKHFATEEVGTTRHSMLLCFSAIGFSTNNAQLHRQISVSRVLSSFQFHV